MMIWRNGLSEILIVASACLLAYVISSDIHVTNTDITITTIPSSAAAALDHVTMITDTVVDRFTTGLNTLKALNISLDFKDFSIDSDRISTAVIASSAFVFQAACAFLGVIFWLTGRFRTLYYTVTDVYLSVGIPSILVFFFIPEEHETTTFASLIGGFGMTFLWCSWNRDKDYLLFRLVSVIYSISICMVGMGLDAHNGYIYLPGLMCYVAGIALVINGKKLAAFHLCIAAGNIAWCYAFIQFRTPPPPPPPSPAVAVSEMLTCCVSTVLRLMGSLIVLVFGNECVGPSPPSFLA